MSDTTRAKAIACMAEATSSFLLPEYLEEGFDALEAAGFTILGPNELQQVGHFKRLSWNLLQFVGDNKGLVVTDDQPVYVRTDGGDAS